MLRISRLTDYAFILLHRLSGADEEVVSCSTLAEQTPLPLPTVRKVCKKLANQGLLVSHQGAHGGYELARPAGEVSAAEVISVMEGPIAVTLCSEGAGECEIEAGCPTSQSWRVINAAIRSALDGVTLADMKRPLKPEMVLAPSEAGAGTDAEPTEAEPVTAADDPRRSRSP